MPSELELEMCRYQGEHLARIASCLRAGRGAQPKWASYPEFRVQGV
jgi:hypothetical protein